MDWMLSNLEVICLGFESVGLCNIEFIMIVVMCDWNFVEYDV